MIRHRVLALILFLMLAASGSSARADCTLTSLGETRPVGALVLNSAHNVVQYCDGTVWKALIWNAQGGSGGGSCTAGDTWIARDSDRFWTGIAMSADGTTIVAGADGDPIITSSDGGASWTEQTASGSRTWFGVASSSDGVKLAAVANGGQIYTSTDSGVNWTARESNRDWASIASSDDGTKLAATVYGGQIYTSTDSGVNWTARDSNRDWTGIASSSDGTKLAAAVLGGQIYTSTNSGVTWNAQASGSRNWTSVTSSDDGTKLAATVAGGQIYTSTDSGVNWTARESNRDWGSIASSADGQKLIAGAEFGNIFVSTNSGVTWTPKAIDAGWNGVAISADGSKMVAGIHGGVGGKIYTSECTGGGGAPNCTDDATTTCTLDADRDSGDPEFTAANIADGVNILGVTGTLTSGGCTAPSLCPNVGDVCDDGNAGNNPDPKFAGFMLYGLADCKPLYVAQDDGWEEWAVTSGIDNIAIDSDEDGQINDAQVPDDWDFPAFKFCKDLTNGGFTDWYLPARLELDLTQRNSIAIWGNPPEEAWSSTEHWEEGEDWAWRRYSSDWKHQSGPVICVRRD